MSDKPIMKQIERELHGDEKAKVERWLKDCADWHAKGYNHGPIAPLVREGFVTSVLIQGDKVIASIWADMSKVSDPFGEAIKAAQDFPEPVAAKGYVPDTFDADEVWRAIMEQRS